MNGNWQVTPLYESKDIKTDLNNYRGISVLPPLGKLFEKVLATQIIIYFNLNNLFFNADNMVSENITHVKRRFMS